MTTLKQTTAERVLRSSLAAVLQAGAEAGLAPAALSRVLAEQLRAQYDDALLDEGAPAVARMVLRQVAAQMLAAGTAADQLRSILARAVDRAVHDAAADAAGARPGSDDPRV